jgi:hypothetical protein
VIATSLTTKKSIQYFVYLFSPSNYKNPGFSQYKYANTINIVRIITYIFTIKINNYLHVLAAVYVNFPGFHE